MDFESVNWDVGIEASDLNQSLFQDNKKKKKKAKKRKQTENVENVAKDDNLNKKRKTDNTCSEAEKVMGGNAGVKTTKVVTKETSTKTNLQMSRKERRNKKWEQKILQRKQMNDKGRTESGSGFGSETTINSTNAHHEKTSNINKAGNTGKAGCTGKAAVGKVRSVTVPVVSKEQTSRFDKRKHRWEQKVQEKKLKVDRNESGGLNDLGAKVEANSGTNSVSINGPMNRKERKKLEWKNKLKESKLNKKNNLENLNDSREVTEQDGDDLKEKNGQHKLVGGKKATGDVNSSQLVKKNKRNKKQKLEHQNCIGIEKEVKKTGEKELTTVNSSSTKDVNSDENADTPSSKEKKKRKRICKKNKFKGYVKSERNITNTSGDKECDSPIKSDCNLAMETKVNTKIKVSFITTDKSSNVEPSLQSIKSKKKKKQKHSSVDNDLSTSTPEKWKSNSVKTVATKKDSKKLALDPKVLNAMLSPNLVKNGSVKEKHVGDEEINDTIAEGNTRKASKTLLEKSRERLNAARFRYINEQLYTTTGQEALKMFRSDKVAFSVYHEGFQGQVEKWPTNPIDVIIQQIKTKPKHLILADFGCGDAKLAQSVANKVHSFDLVALNDHVTICEMSKVPLKDGVVDIAVFCLSLMGTNLTSYLQEANRVLKNNGTLMIAEVASRFHSVGGFILKVEKMGFKIKQQDTGNKMFVMMEFKKTCNMKDKETEHIQLKPCIYKKR